VATRAAWSSLFAPCIASTYAAQLETLKDQGYTHKRWLTARDNRVRVAQGSSRFDHRQMDGGVVPIDEPLVTLAGSGLLYPGDRSLGAPPGRW